MKLCQELTTDGHAVTHWPLTLAVAVLLLAGGVGVWGLFATSKPLVTPAGAASGATGAGAAPTPTQGAASADPGLMADPAVFARWVASTLFDWDTASQSRDDVTARMMAAADPTPEGDADGLASDLDSYLPDQATWLQLRQYATRQTLTIDQIGVPDGWAEAKAQAQPGQLLPGTVAYTVNGTRHRAGTWNGQPVVYEAPVSFTIFIACQPAYPTCYLLRLSLPGQPLN